MPICSTEGCNRLSWARTMCLMHYKRLRRRMLTLVAIPRTEKVVVCSGCYESKKYYAKGLCKHCYVKQWSSRRPSRRAERLTRDYKLSLRGYEDILIKQDHRCAICRKGYNRSLHVDHNHATGSIRGLLCFKCNAAIGYIDDNPEVARTMAIYLEEEKYAALSRAV